MGSAARSACVAATARAVGELAGRREPGELAGVPQVRLTRARATRDLAVPIVRDRDAGAEATALGPARRVAGAAKATVGVGAIGKDREEAVAARATAVALASFCRGLPQRTVARLHRPDALDTGPCPVAARTRKAPALHREWSTVRAHGARHARHARALAAEGSVGTIRGFAAYGAVGQDPGVQARRRSSGAFEHAYPARLAWHPADLAAPAIRATCAALTAGATIGSSALAAFEGGAVARVAGAEARDVWDLSYVWRTRLDVGDLALLGDVAG